MTKLAANSIEGKAQGFLTRIENILAEMESGKGTYMAECKKRREDIKEIYTEAKDQGVNVKALKGVVKARALDKRMKAISDGFDIDEKAAFETLCEALGPLGAAAAKAAGYETKDDADRDLRPSNLRNDEGRKDETQLAALGKGAEAKAAAVDSLAS